MLDVMLGSARGYVQVPRDLSVRKTLGLELQNLDLPVAEPGRSKARLFLQGVPSRVRNGGDGVGVESPLLGLVLYLFCCLINGHRVTMWPALSAKPRAGRGASEATGFHFLR